jgi:UDP-3-O-[3-hydroxymyristoyl] glucosamine N-acyltransferase
MKNRLSQLTQWLLTAVIALLGFSACDDKDRPIMYGSPTVDYNTYLRNATLTPRLPELFKRVSRIEKELGHKPRTEKKDHSLLRLWNNWMAKMHHR